MVGRLGKVKGTNVQYCNRLGWFEKMGEIERVVFMSGRELMHKDNY